MIDYASPVGQVRLLIADTDPDRLILSDNMISGYLGLHGVETGSATRAQVRRAAADAIDAIATSEALISKVLRTQDVTTDGAKLADSLRKQAVSLRALADQIETEDAAAATGGFEVVEFEPYLRRY